MEFRYDEEADAMYIYLEKGGEYDVSQEIGDGVILDVSKEGKISGIEILDVSDKISEAVLKRMVLKEKH